MFLRYPIAAIAGTIVTSSLIWLMQHLITISETGTPIIDEFTVPTLGTVADDTALRQRSLLSKLIERPSKQILPPTIVQNEKATGGTLIPKFEQPHPEFSSYGNRPGQVDSGLYGIVSSQPEYPHSASTRDLEGEVLVQYDVNEAGAVENVTVIRSTHRIFENAAIKAAYRSRYKAKTVDGIPQRTLGLRKLYRFELDD